MKYIESTSDDIYFNLALEEYVFNNLNDDAYFMLWKNDGSIVLGKHQNAFEEINIREAEKAGIKIARRNSGGGTVFHDRGNLNYSFIKNYDKNSFIDYDSFLTPVIAALNSLGIKAEKRRTCDIAIDGRKISGSAQSSRGGRVLHHGTLLFDADLSLMEKLLKPSEGKIKSRSIKSVRSAVTNIKGYMAEGTGPDAFKNSLLKALFPEGIQKTKLTWEQLQEINDLAKNKYSDWMWTFGNSPEFSYEKQSVLSNEPLEIKLHVKKGMISACTVAGEFLPCGHIENAVTGCRYSYAEVTDRLKEIRFLDTNINIEKLADCFF